MGLSGSSSCGDGSCSSTISGGSQVPKLGSCGEKLTMVLVRENTNVALPYSFTSWLLSVGLVQDYTILKYEICPSLRWYLMNYFYSFFVVDIFDVDQVSSFQGPRNSACSFLDLRGALTPPPPIFFFHIWLKLFWPLVAYFFLNKGVLLGEDMETYWRGWKTWQNSPTNPKSTRGLLGLF